MHGGEERDELRRGFAAQSTHTLFSWSLRLLVCDGIGVGRLVGDAQEHFSGDGEQDGSQNRNENAQAVVAQRQTATYSRDECCKPQSLMSLPLSSLDDLECCCSSLKNLGMSPTRALGMDTVKAPLAVSSAAHRELCEARYVDCVHEGRAVPHAPFVGPRGCWEPLAPWGDATAEPSTTADSSTFTPDNTSAPGRLSLTNFSSSRTRDGSVSRDKEYPAPRRFFSCTFTNGEGANKTRQQHTRRLAYVKGRPNGAEAPLSKDCHCTQHHP